MDRLLDVERRRRPKWKGTLAIVHVQRHRCPECGAAVERMRYGQPALFRSHGHGATLTTTLEVCALRCGWAFVPDVTETRPG